MKKNTVILMLAIVSVFFAGCPKKTTIVKEETKASAEVRSDTKEAKAEVETEVKVVAKEDAEAKARKGTEAKIKTEEAEIKAETTKEEPRFEDIHFDFDMYTIKETDREILNNLAGWLLKNKDAKIEIEGHADERGNNEYNLALGERRADSAKKYLVALGINATRITTISYGEEKPLCTESAEDCWLKNRRAHFIVRK